MPGSVERYSRYNRIKISFNLCTVARSRDTLRLSSTKSARIQTPLAYYNVCIFFHILCTEPCACSRPADRQNCVCHSQFIHLTKSRWCVSHVLTPYVLSRVSIRFLFMYLHFKKYFSCYTSRAIHSLHKVDGFWLSVCRICQSHIQYGAMYMRTRIIRALLRRVASRGLLLHKLNTHFCERETRRGRRPTKIVIVTVCYVCCLFWLPCVCVQHSTHNSVSRCSRVGFLFISHHTKTQTHAQRDTHTPRHRGCLLNVSRLLASTNTVLMIPRVPCNVAKSLQQSGLCSARSTYYRI